MGCIPSKQNVLEGDASTLSATPVVGTKSQKEKKGMAKRKEKKLKRGLESPVLDDNAAPWVKGHRVLSEKDGEILITDRAS